MIQRADLDRAGHYGARVDREVLSRGGRSAYHVSVVQIRGSAVLAHDLLDQINGAFHAQIGIAVERARVAIERRGSPLPLKAHEKLEAVCAADAIAIERARQLRNVVVYSLGLHSKAVGLPGCLVFGIVTGILELRGFHGGRPRTCAAHVVQVCC